MKRIQKIMACIDLSEYSLMTLEYAMEIAGNTDAEVVVFSVINQRDISGIEMVSVYYPDKFNVEEYTKKMKKDRHEALKQMIKDHFFDEKSKITIHIETGIPSECILDAAKAENVDMIVMANKGRGNLSRIIFGSAAERVFRHSPVPVVSVRDERIFHKEK